MLKILFYFKIVKIKNLTFSINTTLKMIGRVDEKIERMVAIREAASAGRTGVMVTLDG